MRIEISIAALSPLLSFPRLSHPSPNVLLARLQASLGSLPTLQETFAQSVALALEDKMVAAYERLAEQAEAVSEARAATRALETECSKVMRLRCVGWTPERGNETTPSHPF